MIKEFRDETQFLSNFFPCTIEYGGITYQNTEAAFQAQKVPAEDRTVFAPLNAKEAKRLGRMVQLRNDWESVKDEVMYEVVLAKFSQNPELQELLLKTGDELLVEGNRWHDNIWGSCYCPKCTNIVGQNKLGNILMAVRNELRHQKELASKRFPKAEPVVKGNVHLTLNKADFATMVLALCSYARYVQTVGSPTLQKESEHAYQLAETLQTLTHLSGLAQSFRDDTRKLQSDKETLEAMAENLQVYLGKQGVQTENTDMFAVEFSFSELWQLSTK